MQISLKYKTAIVTGASRGIGKAIALKLGEMGAAVAVNYVHNAQLANAVCSEIIRMGGQAVAVKADMKNVNDIEIMFDRTIKKWGQMDILINNAGIAEFQKIEAVSEKTFDTLFATNVKGVFFACQQAARKMKAGGKIINISSTVTRVMMARYGLYAASKGAVDQFTKVLAVELGSKGITVNSILPGPVDTDLFRQGKTEEQIESIANMAVFKRLGTPQDIAKAVALLLSDEAGWVTGQSICVNGGLAA